MSNELIHSHGVMEGKGAYNKHAKIPAGGGALALPHLENAVRKIAARVRGPVLLELLPVFFKPVCRSMLSIPPG
jgi:hypothetical protein